MTQAFAHATPPVRTNCREITAPISAICQNTCTLRKIRAHRSPPWSPRLLPHCRRGTSSCRLIAPSNVGHNSSAQPLPQRATPMTQAFAHATPPVRTNCREITAPISAICQNTCTLRKIRAHRSPPWSPRLLPHCRRGTSSCRLIAPSNVGLGRRYGWPKNPAWLSPWLKAPEELSPELATPELALPEFAMPVLATPEL